MKPIPREIGQRWRARSTVCVAVGVIGFTALALSGQEPRSRSPGNRPEIDLSKPIIIFCALVESQWDLFAWSPDSSAPPHRLTRTPEDELRPSISADRRSLVYETTDGRLHHLELTTGKTRLLPFASDQCFDMQPAVSPDGKSLLLATSLSRKLDDTNLALLHLNEQQSSRQLRFPSSQFFPAWAPDGQRFAFVNLHARGWVGRVTTEIWMGRLDQRMARQLTMLDSLTIDPSWTPDGKRVLFASNHEQQYEIYSLNVEKRTVSRLTNHTSADTDPVSSPDGSAILFVSTRSGSLALWLLREGNTQTVELRPFGDQCVRCKDPDWR